MELSYENLKKNPKAFRAFTGFDVGEFQILLHAFTIAWGEICPKTSSTTRNSPKRLRRWTESSIINL
jgi:hypothetical protein